MKKVLMPALLCALCTLSVGLYGCSDASSGQSSSETSALNVSDTASSSSDKIADTSADSSSDANEDSTTSSASSVDNAQAASGGGATGDANVSSESDSAQQNGTADNVNVSNESDPARQNEAVVQNGGTVPAGQVDSTSPYIGKWELRYTEAPVQDDVLSTDDVRSMIERGTTMTATLNADGTLNYDLFNYPEEGTWMEDGNNIILTIDGDTMTGHIESETMLTLIHEEMVLHFEKQ